MVVKQSKNLARLHVTIVLFATDYVHMQKLIHALYRCLDFQADIIPDGPNYVKQTDRFKDRRNSIPADKDEPQDKGQT